ncbi:MAG: hypothetical protein KJI71_01080 [Patescibacteria group bacterium]|nr:hypothetical protein [Patescibacteria group bacterium]
MKEKIKKYLILIMIIGGLFAFNTLTFAHPGRTAADGCHYCRTNCSSWGVAWNQRHCHGVRALPQAEVPKEGSDGSFWGWIIGLGVVGYIYYISKNRNE